MFSKLDGYFKIVKDCTALIESEKDEELVELAKEELEEVLDDILSTQDKACQELVPVSELDEKD